MTTKTTKNKQLECHVCLGDGFIEYYDYDRDTCPKCKGKGYQCVKEKRS